MKRAWNQRRRVLCSGAMMLAAALGLSAPAAASQAVGLEERFASAGLRPFAEPAPAPDFELPQLGQGVGTLSGFGGQWVVLTFWASWCGPCRSEMPSLESVHRALGDRGLVVVGVSVDQQAAPAEAFTSEYGLSFPSFLDADGAAASSYHASSIPVSYLVDPRGRVVAMARGARDWRALQPVLEAALEALPPGDPERAAFAQDGPLRMPAVRRPPSATVRVTESVPRPGQSFDLVVDLWWAGDFEEYLPQPPQVQLPEGVTRQRVTAETSSREGRHHVVYRIGILAQEPGRYALDPVELRYLPRFESEPVVERVAGPTVEVVAPGRWLGKAALGAGGLILVAVAGAAGWRRRRSARQAPAEEGAFYQRLQEQLATARARRLDGDVAGCLKALLEVEQALGQYSEEEESELEGWLEAARFGGQAPSSGALDRWQRRAERRLATERPDPRAAERKQLRLRSGDGLRQEETR